MSDKNVVIGPNGWGYETKTIGGGSVGTNNYDQLSNKPFNENHSALEERIINKVDGDSHLGHELGSVKNFNGELLMNFWDDTDTSTLVQYIHGRKDFTINFKNRTLADNSILTYADVKNLLPVYKKYDQYVHLANESNQTQWQDMNKSWNVYGNVRQIFVYALCGKDITFDWNHKVAIVNLDKPNWSGFHYFIGTLRIKRTNSDSFETYPIECGNDGNTIYLSPYGNGPKSDITINIGDVILVDCNDVHSQLLEWMKDV